jgi:hypothetical protein
LHVLKSASNYEKVLKREEDTTWIIHPYQTRALMKLVHIEFGIVVATSSYVPVVNGLYF